MIYLKRSLTFVLLFLLTATVVSAQDGKPTATTVVVDQIVAVVGGNEILLSDIENEYIQAMLQGNSQGGAALRCRVIEEALFQKLLLVQAEIDSVVVTDKQVENELERRMRYFISQVGSKEKLEAYFGKSIVEIKEDLRDRIEDHLRIQDVQSRITANVKVTPAEIADFYNGIPADSLPLVSSEYEIMQIVKKPPISDAEVALVKEKLNSIRDRVLKGEDFSTLANLYSNDPGSMSKGGNLGLIGRGETYPEFEAAAFSLKPGEISPVIKTEKGYHIIQMIERKGEFVNVKHILIIPQPGVAELGKAQEEIERIVALIRSDSLTFEQAAQRFSDDPTKNNGGLLTNPYSGNSFFDAQEVDPAIFFIVDKLKVGEISAPVIYTDEEDMRQGFRVLMLKSFSQPHQASLKDDYPRIQNMVLMYKQNEEINKWIRKKSEATYIKINPDYISCDFQYDWSTAIQEQ